MTCPQCSTAVATARDAVPWCPSCEWNLDHFEPDRRRPEVGWRWADRASHQVAWRLAAGQFARLVDGPLERRAWSVARVVTMAVAVLLLAFVAAVAALGVWLFRYDFPGFGMLPGLALLGLAVLLRPRLGGLPGEVHVLDRDEAPELHALVDRVAAATGAAAGGVGQAGRCGVAGGGRGRAGEPDSRRTRAAAAQPARRGLALRVASAHRAAGRHAGTPAAHAAAVVLTEAQSARIDDEIAGPVERARRDLASGY